MLLIAIVPRRLARNYIIPFGEGRRGAGFDHSETLGIQTISAEVRCGSRNRYYG